MAEIKVLDKHIAELIAAGEVVERPSSVIKELVENSIDAGATSITVEIKSGGITFMRVTDNGSGISRAYVATAFLRHATSKVNSADDLDSIASLGFRGEALASIAAVSHIELLTKTGDEEIGTRLTSDGGEINDVSDAGCPTGTTIIVRDLFYNVPARMKFLKRDIGEANAISGIIDKIALSHSEISFRLIREGKESLHSAGDSKLSSAIYAVYGKNFLSTLIPVEYEMNNIKIWGYISSPEGARPSRGMQSFFINGRFVKSRTAFAALEEAVKGSIMVGKFPACVLHIDVNCSLVDVNVHPAKLEVRFANEKPIFDVVYHAVKSALLTNGKPKAMEFSAKKPIIPAFTVPKRPTEIKQEQIRIPLPQRNVPSFGREIKREPLVFHDSEESQILKKAVSTKLESLLDVEPKSAERKTETLRLDEIEVSREISTNEPVVAEVKTQKFIGEAFNTYIIIEYGNALMLIDKHAAHERILYEKLKKDSAGKDAQTLLSPIPVTLDKQSYTAIIANLESLDKAGFRVDDFGDGTVIVRSAPLSLEGHDVSDAIISIADSLDNRNTIATEYMDWLYHNIACRAAIKGGNISSDEELIALAKLLEENPEIKHCPHGRPVSIIIEKREIEKQFGRL